MASSIASQLQAIKSVLKGAPDAIRRPRTRPSVIFDPKEAADIDLRTILPIALSGLEVLVDLDGRFRKYEGTLFSQTSLELDREKMVPKEEEKINKSIHSYLRLLSGHLQLPAALKTLEYLVRRYQVHVFNMDELVLCALPYHDTHAFVRIVQLLDLGNNKWAFLEGIKNSGAPPPRQVIVQQCIRDKGLLEILCNYASPTKDFQHSRPVVCFCTAVIVEALGVIPELDTDTVQRVLGFVFNGLNPTMRGGRDDKAGALMVVGLLATRATLAPKLSQNLVLFIARMAQHDANQSVDLPWLRVMIMAIISLVQSQSMQLFPKKTLMFLKDIRDLPGVLSGLSSEFNIQGFLGLYLGSLIEYSTSDDSCCITLINMLEALALKDFVGKIVSKVLSYCMKLSRGLENSSLCEAGIWAKKILVVVGKHYPCELRGAIHKFLESSKINACDEQSILETLSQLFDGSLDIPMEISDPKLWFSLEHPKVAVRQATLSNIAASGMLKSMAANPQKVINLTNAIIRGLHDDDLRVVEAALSVDGLVGLVEAPCLLKAYHHVLSRCTDILYNSTSKTSRACNIAVSCLERLVVEFRSLHIDCSKEIATTLFPLLLVVPKTWRVNLKALELVKQVEWPFYIESSIAYDSTFFDQMKNLEFAHATSINMKTIGALAEMFATNPEEHMQWLVECSNCGALSKSLFFLIMLQALKVQNEESGSLLKLYQACFSALKNEWHEMEPQGGVSFVDELNLDKLDKPCIGFVDQLLHADVDILNLKILICIFWSLLKRYVEIIKQNTMAETDEWLSILNELFIFFVTSPSKNVFKRHLQFLVTSCSKAPCWFLSKYFAEEGVPVEIQVESLLLFSTLCSMSELSEDGMDENSHLQHLLGFPSLLIPLSNENKDVRTAAVNCVEGLYKMWRLFDVSRLRNGNDTILSRCVSSPTFGDFLESIVSQKKLISSDGNFLSSYLTSMLSLSDHNFLVPDSIHNRFDQPTKDAILLFILSSTLRFSSYGKLVVLSLLKGLGNIILHVGGVKSLLFELLERRNKYHFGLDKVQQKLSKTEIETLCLLLEVCVPVSSSAHIDADMVDCLIKALRVDALSPDDAAVVRPCVTVLQSLTPAMYGSLKTEIQDQLFGNLVFLFRNDNGDIRNAAREALLRININCSTIVRFLELILSQDHELGSAKRVKRKKNLIHFSFGISQDTFSKEEPTLSILVSFLDILLLKKNIKKRESLVQPLFQALEKLFSNDWLLGLIGQGEKGSGALSEVPESLISAVYQAQQITLLVLKDITDSLILDHPIKDDMFDKVNMNLLIECAHTAKDVASRNHVFLLLSSVAKVSSRWVSEHIVDIFTVIGESAVKQNDSHSQQVLEDMISTLVPRWLSKTNSVGELLQIFIKALPDVIEHRRLTLMVYLLRTLGEEGSLGVLVVYLFHSLASRITKFPSKHLRDWHDFVSSSSFILNEWEYEFAAQIFDQYSCKIWFPCLVKVLQEIRVHSEQEGLLHELYLAMQFILYKMHDTELVFELESGQDRDCLQITLGELMEQVVLHSQLVTVRRKQVSVTSDIIKAFKDCANRVLKTITRWMLPSAYFKGITQLLGHADGSVKRKTLGLLSETVKHHSLVQKNPKEMKKMKQKFMAFPLHIDESSAPSFNELCLKIVELIDNTTDGSDSPMKLAAVSSIEIMAKEFPSDNLIYATCLTVIVKHIGSDNSTLSSGCIRTTGALISVLGSKALSQLPLLMKHMIARAHEISNCPIGNFKHNLVDVSQEVTSHKVSLLLSILVTLEAVVEKLGGFLNPYLADILDLLVLHPEYASELDMKMKLKAATVRKLLSEKIPARLMLTPLLQIYSSSLKCGELSLCLVFEMLSSMIGAMDRSSIVTYHAKLFEQCLMALDLRRQHPESVRNINMVEQSVIHAMIVLTMKLTETMFRPLFLHSLEWAESEFEGSHLTKSRSLERTISFYMLVSKLIEQHRSLFVPYFKYLLEGCIQYLAEDQDGGLPTSTQKRKKAKVGDTHNLGKDKVLSAKQWHLRALILKSLYHCFLYDTDQKFLDSSNFQFLLKPIVSQLVVEPPASLEQMVDVPTVEEVDESLVLCLGQMAVTARSDVLWKPLNHEVLMHTRNEKVRPRILGLKVVKYLVEHLKEEYLVFLPETIPFLGELLEDVELPVKTLVQEILKEMETLSGESLRQYL
uniref:Uncharacterized protein At3g06530 n=1 Tax=Elaeis guineensis var. tenera TaxID=51953 RepID=A0A6I9R4X7_ELAGV|nr:uncharacterized protein At3g06530 [Elaeis guineensis]